MYVVLIPAATSHAAKLDRLKRAEVFCEGLQQGQLLSDDLIQLGAHFLIGRIARLDTRDQTAQCRLATWKWFLALNALAEFGFQLLCSRDIDTRESKFDSLYTRSDGTDRALRIAQERILKVAGSVRWIEFCFAHRVKLNSAHAAGYRRINE